MVHAFHVDALWSPDAGWAQFTQVGLKGIETGPAT
jgi:hypothetical protein